jgi:hypothetical protein
MTSIIALRWESDKKRTLSVAERLIPSRVSTMSSSTMAQLLRQKMESGDATF